MSTTSHVTIDEGSTTQLPTYDISEDATTKKLSRSVLNKSDGTELIGQQTAANSIPVILPSATVTTLTPPSNTGYSTSAKQDTELASLASIDGKITAVNTGAVTVAASALPSGASTAANQSTSNTSLGNIDTNAGATSDAAATAGGTGTISAKLRKISADIGTVATNTGAATPAGTNLIGKVGIDQTTPGTTNAVAPVPVDLSPATQNVTVQDTGSSVGTGANSQPIITGSPTANSTASFSLSGLETVTVQVSGTWTGTLQSELSMDGGTTWYVRGVHQTGSTYTVSTFTANFAGGLNVGGYTNFRIRATAAITGTAVVKVVESVNPNSIYLANAARIADATTPSQQLAVDSSGRITLAPNQSTNIAQMNGVTTAMGVGASSTGTQRIVLANDNGKTVVSTGGSASSSGNNTLVAAGTNKLKVFAFSLSTTSTTAVTCIFQSGASGTELWRVVLQAVTGSSTGANLVVAPPAYLFATGAATLLNLNLSGAQTVHWSVSYYDEA